MVAGPGLPLFLDRSVGTKRVAAGLRALGLTVQTIDDRYGTGAAPSVDDPTWITEAARDGYVLLGADLRIRYRTAERWALCRASARYLAFPRGDLTAVQMVERVGQHRRSIDRVLDEPGPWVRHLMPAELRSMRLDCSDLPP